MSRRVASRVAHGAPVEPNIKYISAPRPSSEPVARPLADLLDVLGAGRVAGEWQTFLAGRVVGQLGVPIHRHALRLQRLQQHRAQRRLAVAPVDAVRLGNVRMEPQPAQQRIPSAVALLPWLLRDGLVPLHSMACRHTAQQVRLAAGSS